MLVLTLKTDQPEAQLCLYRSDELIVEEKWVAHRQLAETIHKKISLILQAQGKDLNDIKGIICYEGPGSFTGLRIGLSVGNALAYGLHVPIVGAGGEDWEATGLERLKDGQHKGIALPEYGGEVHITPPKK